jgi:RNA polymerase sigma-70 factor (ECF subfamily)
VRTGNALRARADLELARRCCSGERAAQRDLFHRERRRVHAALYRILGTNAEMDDLVQEAFLEVFRALRTFRGEASLGTWIDRIAVRVACAHIARRKRKPVSLELVADVPSRDAGAEQRAMSREAARRLYAVLDGVEPRQRVAYVLHVVEGRPIADVAQVMGATAVLTRVRVWRARRTVEAAAQTDPLLVEFVRE